MPAQDDGAEEAERRDLVYVHAESPEGDGYQVIRSRGGTLEAGEIRGLQDGQAIHGEVVKLHPTTDSKRLFDVEVLVQSPEPAERSASGPPQVATKAYRERWEAIFQRPPDPEELN